MYINFQQNFAIEPLWQATNQNMRTNSYDGFNTLLEYVKDWLKWQYSVLQSILSGKNMIPNDLGILFSPK